MPRTFGVFLSIAAASVAFSCSSPPEDTDTDVTAISQAVLGQCYRYRDAIMAAATAVVDATFNDGHEHEWGIFVYQASPDCWVHGQPFMGGDGFINDAQLCHVIKYSLKPEFNRAGLYIPTIALVPTLRDCQSQTAA
jgi:hypothetical protein